MDFFHRVMLAVWAFRVMVLLMGVSAIYTGYRISKISITAQPAVEGSRQVTGRLPSLRRAIRVVLAALGAVIIAAGLLWPIPIDWARRVSRASETEIIDSTRSQNDSTISREAPR